MDKSELRDLLEFVKSSNANIVVEAINSFDDMVLNEIQIRTLVNAINSKTDDCFFRFMDKAIAKPTKRSRKK